MTTKAKDLAALNGLYDPVDQAEPNAGLLRRIANSLADRAGAHFERRSLRSTVRVLQSMDDRMLADLGMSRGEIHSLVYNGRSDKVPRCGTSLK